MRPPHSLELEFEQSKSFYIIKLLERGVNKEVGTSLFLMILRSSSLVQYPELGDKSSAVFCIASSILTMMSSSFICNVNT